MEINRIHHEGKEDEKEDESRKKQLMRYSQTQFNKLIGL
jgi:hypothetical protein